MNWKLGTVLLVSLICASTIIPNNSIEGVSDVKTNSLVPFNLHKRTGNELQKRSINEFCAPYCKDQCSKREEAKYKNYCDVAKKVHKNIPTLYGKSSKTKENYTFLNEGKDEILDY